jgi:hypothetical protein
MKILAIDPGNTMSAWVVYEEGVVLDKGKEANEKVLDLVTGLRKSAHIKHMAIEMIACYGMAVGVETFDTCVWIGMFVHAWRPKPYTRVRRMEVKMHLCHNTQAKDGNIRQAIIDRYPASGGGKIPQIGTKGQPGPLYGVSADIWAAIGVAITYAEGGCK